MEDVKELLNAAEEDMEMAAMHLEECLSRIRAGKANVHILDGIRVDSYGCRWYLRWLQSFGHWKT